jgi:tetratricopeptide (TPR) repeat protein
LARKPAEGFLTGYMYLIEKVPFFMLSIASSVITVKAQGAGDAILPIWAHPLADRVIIAAKAICFYLFKILWPVNLAPVYPFPVSLSLDYVYIVSFVLVIAVTYLGVWSWKRGRRVFLAVWIFYIISLLPVLGLIQTGGHEIAYRYTYLPILGPFLLVGMAVELARNNLDIRWDRTGNQKTLFFIPLLFVLAAMSYSTIKQEMVWRDSISLWTEEIALFPDMHLAYDSRADAFAAKGRLKDAIKDLKRSIAINPRNPLTYFRIGMVYERSESYIRALQNYARAAELNPRFEPARRKRDLSYQRVLEDLGRDIELNPGDASIYINRGNIHALMENYQGALDDYEKAFRINPDIPEMYYNRGMVFMKTQQYPLAVEDYSTLIKMNPQDSQAYYFRGIAYERLVCRIIIRLFRCGS